MEARINMETQNVLSLVKKAIMEEINYARDMSRDANERSRNAKDEAVARELASGARDHTKTIAGLRRALELVEDVSTKEVTQ
jgi:cation transport regulator ChaB